MSLDQVFDLAVQHHQAGRLADAELLYRQILVQKPNCADALHYLGVIACQVGRGACGVDLIQQAIGHRPAWPDAYCNLGKAFRKIGKPSEAIAAFRQAIMQSPNCAEAECGIGDVLSDRGEWDEAIAAYRRAIAIIPDFSAALANLGNALKQLGQPHEAVAEYRKVVALRAGDADAYSNLGVALKADGHVDEAIDAHYQAIAIRPDFPAAWSNLGAALAVKERFDDAIAAFRHAIALNPQFVEAHSNLGNALQSQGHLDDALAVYRQAIALNPNFSEAFSNLGVALMNKGQLDEAIAVCRHAVALNPRLADAHYNLSLALLLSGDLVQGWAEHEWRSRASNLNGSRWNYSQPRWDGSDLANGTLLLHAEQGFGDTIQFIRYVPFVTARCRKIIVACHPALKRLIESVPGVMGWFDSSDPKRSFDAHCPMMSLPAIFGTTLKTIPSSVPYLKAFGEEVELWQQRLLVPRHPRQVGIVHPVAADRSRLHRPSLSRAMKVGLAWAGSPKHKNDRNRSISPSILAPLAPFSGVIYLSLQMGLASEQTRHLAAGMTLIDWTQELHDFSDTAALIANLDLVICVDTAVAHLAGAMGKPVWALLPFAPDWRWLLQREDSPWYPTMRLFRQPRIGDWSSVIQKVADALSELLKSRAKCNDVS